MSRSSTRLAERCLVLKQISDGLLTRTWALKHGLKDSGDPNARRYPSVQKEEWSRIRKKLESVFPEIPDLVGLQKIQGFDSFKGCADDVIRENVEVFALLMDCLDFKGATMEALFSVFGSRGQYQLWRAGPVLSSALELLVAFAQLHLLWVSIEQRKGLVSLFMVAHRVKNDHRNDPFFHRVASYLEESSTGLKWLVAQLMPISPAVGDAILEVAEPLRVSLDVNLMRQLNVFSVLEEGAAMPLPAKRPLSARSPRLQLHQELIACPRYAVFVLWGGLLCPGELFREGVLEVFKVMLAEHALLPIFRDENLEVVGAVEEIWSFFPPKQYVPSQQGNKDLKHKKIFKELFKPEAYYTSTLLRHRERAAYLSGEMRNLLSLLRNIPGLLAPKFMMVMALSSLTKAEVLWSLNHHGPLEQWGSTKRSKKALQADKDATTSNARVVELIGLLDALCTLAREHEPIVRQYYAEYLHGAHTTGLEDLINEFLEASNIQGEMRDLLRSFDKHLASAASQPPSSISPDCPSLKALRVGWLRAVTLLTSWRSNGEGQVSDELWDRLHDRMNGLVSTSSLVDSSLHTFVHDATSLQQAWWYREALTSATQDVLAAAIDSPDPTPPPTHTSSISLRTTVVPQATASVGDGASLGLGHVLAVVKAIGEAAKNVHPAWADEERPLRASMVTLSTTLMEEVLELVDTLTTEMWEKVRRLAVQVSPVEALLRMERALATKTRPEPFPGRESMPSMATDPASPVVRDLMRLQHGAAVLLQSIATHPEVRVAGRTFFVKRQVAAKLDEALMQHIHNCYDIASFARPSVVLPSILCYLVALQRTVGDHLLPHTDPQALLHSIRRRLLESGWVSSTGETIGTGDAHMAPQSFIQLDHTQALCDQTRPIGRISSWFINFLETVALHNHHLPAVTDNMQATGTQQGGVAATGASVSSPLSGLIYSDVRRTFIRYPPPVVNNSAPLKSGRGSFSARGSFSGQLPPAATTAVTSMPTSPPGVIEAELYTDIHELRALVELVGPMGVDIIDADLLSYVNSHMRDIRVFLATNSEALKAFKTSVADISLTSTLPTAPQATERFLQDMLRVGNALALRHLLYSALSESFTSRHPGLASVFNNTYHSVDMDGLLAGHSRQLAGLDRFARFANGAPWGGEGNVAVHDTRLAACLDEITHDWHVWLAILPAVAVSLGCDWWRDCGPYVLEHDAFMSNQQLVWRVISEVLRILKAKNAAAADADKVDIGALGKDFVAACSSMILKVKQQSLAADSNDKQPGNKANSQPRTSHVHGLIVMLERWVEMHQGDNMDRGTLEAHMPYALIHHAYVELALEKQQAGVAINNHTGSTKDEGPILLSGGKDQVNRPLPFLDEESLIGQATGGRQQSN